MIPLVMWTKVAAKERELSRFMLNLGMQISMTSCNLERIMVKKRIEHVIYSMLFGFLIYS